MAAEIKVKFINRRIDVVNEPIRMGTVYYCKDTGESFFDEDATVRISLGTDIVISSLKVSSLPKLTLASVGKCAVIVEDNTFYTANSDLEWVKLTSSDDLLEVIGSPERFVPHSFYKHGTLLAPRTLMSCVYDNTGIPVGDKILKLMNWMDNVIYNGIDASMIKTGVFNINLIPKSAMMDYVVVKDTAARLALKIDRVQNGDVVQESDTSKAYFVIDETKLGTEAAFQEFTTSSTPWSGVTNRPISLTISGGVNGSVSFDTASGTRLSMPNTTLNMAHATEGVLSKERGGTGNQNGKAATVVHTAMTTNQTSYLVGYNSNGTSVYSKNSTIKNGIISARAFNATDSAIASSLFNTVITGNLTLSPGGASPSSTALIFKDGSKQLQVAQASSGLSRLFIGDSGLSIGTTLYGATSKIMFKQSNGYLVISCAESISAEKNISKYDANKIVDYVNHEFDSDVTIYNSSQTTTTNITSDKLNNLASGVGTTVKGTVFTNNYGNFTFRNSAAGSAGLLSITPSKIYVSTPLEVRNTSTFTGVVTVSATKTSGGYNIDGYARYAVDSTKFNGKSVSDFVLKSEVSNSSLSAVVVQSSAPTGRTNCLWVNSSTGVASFWNGSAWVNLSSVWKNS